VVASKSRVQLKARIFVKPTSIKRDRHIDQMMFQFLYYTTFVMLHF